MKITCLAENTAVNDCFGCEHGLSLFIETGAHRILFDMGQTDLFAENAEKLDIDLASADFAVLSHGHYDHGGGLARFLEINRTAPVYLSRHAFGPHYNGTQKYIGLDTSLCGHPRLVFTEDAAAVGEGMTLYSCNSAEKSYDLGSFGLNMIENGAFVPDDFRHEQYLLIEENGRKILFSGCSHKGVMNIADWFEPDVLIGGFHFSKLSPGDTLTEYARILNRHNTLYYTCHCTGAAAFAHMKPHMERLYALSAGQTLVL